MAGQYTPGCFICGSPHHQNYECDAQVDAQESKLNKKANKELHNSVYPAKKYHEDVARATKFMNKLSAKGDAENVSWRWIMDEVSRLTDFYRAMEQKIEDCVKMEHQLILEVCENVLETATNNQTAVRNELESTRIILAYGKQKLAMKDNRSDFDSNVHKSELENLRTIKTKVWYDVTKRAVDSRRILLTVKEVLELKLQIKNWIIGLKQYFQSGPTDVNYPKIDEQYAHQRGDFETLQHRGTYLSEIPTLKTPVSDLIEKVGFNLQKAHSVRSEYEVAVNRQKFIAELAFACGDESSSSSS